MLKNEGTSPHFSHQVVAKRRKDRPDKARDRDPRKRTVGYVEEADRAQRSQAGSLRRCSRAGVRNAGYSLLEMMIASSISIIVLVGFLSIFGQFQTWSSNLNLLLERDSNLWLAPLLFSRWITPAGNNRWDSAWSGVTVHADRLELNSDIHGPSGFPDSELSSTFEALVLRSSNLNLQLKSGRGSFQPLMKNIADFQVDAREIPLLSIRLSAVTDRPLSGSQENRFESTHFLFFLRNYRSNLFLETPQ